VHSEIKENPEAANANRLNCTCCGRRRADDSEESDLVGRPTFVLDVDARGATGTSHQARSDPIGHRAWAFHDTCRTTTCDRSSVLFAVGHDGPRRCAGTRRRQEQTATTRRL